MWEEREFSNRPLLETEFQSVIFNLGQLLRQGARVKRSPIQFIMYPKGNKHDHNMSAPTGVIHTMICSAVAIKSSTEPPITTLSRK